MIDTAPTKLERARAGEEAPPRPTPVDALKAARRMWMAEQRIDMGALARELSISRATLYTWVGGREQLLAEVMWSLAETTLAQARAAAKGKGGTYIAGVVEHYLTALGSFQPTRDFIARDPELAMRVLTRQDTPFLRRLVAANRELLSEQVEAGAYDPPLDIDTLAYLIVRVGESFIYSNVITGAEPDLEKACQAIRVLLHVPVKRN